jgi:hypothetical protein
VGGSRCSCKETPITSQACVSSQGPTIAKSSHSDPVSAWAAIKNATDCGSKQQTFSHNSGSQRSEIKMLAEVVLVAHTCNPSYLGELGRIEV